MKRTVIATFFLLASTQLGLAETCHERFVSLLTDTSSKGPVKIHVTQEIKGGGISKNYFYQAKEGHWLTEMIEPANMDWVLTYNNTMFTSSDKGKSWKKLRTLDAQQNTDDAARDLAENAKTTRNAACGEEEVAGAMHDTVEADFDTLQNFKTENHFKYWVNRQTGWISKATYNMKGEGFESLTTQLPEQAPGLKLPTPE